MRNRITVTVEGIIVYDPSKDLEEIDSNRPIYLLSNAPIDVYVQKRADGRLEIYVNN